MSSSPSAQVQDIAAPARDEQVAVAVKRLAKLRDVDLNALRSGRWRMFPPELVDQALRRDNLVRVDQQVRQQGTALAGADIGVTVLGDHFKWAKQAEIHS